MRTIGFIASLLVSGCDLGDTTEELTDVGRACVTADGGYDAWDSAGTGNTTQLAAGEEAVVTVVLTECESGSVGFEGLGCTAEIDGTTLTVSSSTIRTSPSTQTDDCNVISVECATPQLAEGSWTIAYGGGAATFEVPHDGEAPCAEGAEYSHSW